MTGNGQAWWQGATIYQVYVRSFCDSNGDGQGDLPGLTSKLDYLSKLGVDAVWLSPVHPSPNRDWGYDVSDYDGVHPDYGTLDDFDKLIGTAHNLGLKVITDEVLAHTSDEHPWFVESVKGHARQDWYVWAPPKEDGTAPNNWLSAFGGPAWAYAPTRRRYYHHKFLRQQPKLNWRNEDARKAALNVLETWLLKGVDGFRLDVANAYLHDEALTDNPPVAEALRAARNWSHAPNLQSHLHDSNLPDNITVLDEIRRLVERHPDRFVMGEFSEEPERSGCFAAPDKGLHSGYSFPLLEARKLGPEFIREHYATLARHPGHWPSIAFSNHDVMRARTRFGGPNASLIVAKMLMAILLTLRGNPLIYQGEELGLPQADIARKDIKDPVGDLYYPYTGGRDGCRTPMPWDAAMDNLGFSTAKPWLPIPDAHKDLSASLQMKDSTSVLNFTRGFLIARKKFPSLRSGEIEFLDAPSPILCFIRTLGEERVIAAFNMSNQEAEFSAAEVQRAQPLGLGFGSGTRDGVNLKLGPYGARFGRLS